MIKKQVPVPEEKKIILLYLSYMFHPVLIIANNELFYSVIMIEIINLNLSFLSKFPAIPLYS